MKVRTRVALALLAAPLVYAQTAEPSFAAASIKPVPRTRSGTLGKVEFHPGGRLTANDVTVPILIAAAYDLPFPNPLLSGGPDWVTSERFAERFAVEAVSDAGSIPEDIAPVELRKKMQPMLRRLLSERFKLVLQTERKEMQVFKLIVAPSGSKLTKSPISEAQCSLPTAPDNCHDLTGARSRGAQGTAVSLDDLAKLLEASSAVPVVNATGLNDLFSIKMGPYSRVTPLQVPRGDCQLAGRSAQTAGRTVAKCIQGVGARLRANTGIGTGGCRNLQN